MAATYVHTCCRVLDPGRSEDFYVNKLGTTKLDEPHRVPGVCVGLVRDELGVAFDTANKLAESLEALGLLEETTGGQRNRVFRYTPYWRLLEEPESAVEKNVPPQTPTFAMAGVDPCMSGIVFKGLERPRVDVPDTSFSR